MRPPSSSDAFAAGVRAERVRVRWMLRRRALAARTLARRGMLSDEKAQDRAAQALIVMGDVNAGIHWADAAEGQSDD